MRRRTLAHYLLLTLAVVYFIEQFVFLTTALSHAGRESLVANRFLVLTVGVFLTAVAALFGFLRVIEAPALAVIALIIIQPGIGAAANAVAGMPQRYLAVSLAAAAVAIALLAIVVRLNSAAK